MGISLVRIAFLMMTCQSDFVIITKNNSYHLFYYALSFFFYFIRMFAGWCYASKFNLNSSLRIILKDSLRSVPLFGWAMQIMMYIFLSRKREMDIPHIKRMLSYLLCTGATPTLFLFPEGTDLSESNKKKSNACKYFIVHYAV